MGVQSVVLKFKIFAELLDPNDKRNFKAVGFEGTVEDDERAGFYHKHFLDCVPQTRLFALQTDFLRALPTQIQSGDWRGYIDVERLDPNLPERPFFLGEPFKCTWIEPAADDERLFKVNMPLNVNEPDKTTLAEVFGVGVSSINGEYVIGIYMLIQDPETGKVRHGVNFMIIEKTNYQGSQLHCWVHELFRFQAKAQLGEEKLRERLRIGSGKDRKLVKIKKIVHIRPKKKGKHKLTLDEPSNIVWSHSWESRAHWRILPGGIGKGPDWVYDVKGWTWVVASVKGPDKDNPVTKIRVVQGPQYPQSSQRGCK